MAKKDYDKLLFRLTSILTKLSNNEKPTVQELSREFNVSVRTIQRDIYNRLSGFPIVSNTNKQLEFIEGFSLNKTKLSLEEVTTMTLSLELIKNKGKEFQEASSKLMQKFLYQDVFNPYYIKPLPSEEIDTDSPLLNSIEDAIKYKNLITLEKNNSTREKVAPIKIINYDGFWYLLSKYHNKVSIDMISKIKNVKVLPIKFSISDNEMHIYEKVHTPFFNEERDFLVLLHISKEVGHYFRLKEYLPSQKIEKEYKNGSIEISFKVTHIEEIDNLIKSWLPDIRVIKPLWYKNKIIKELQQYLNDTMLS